MEYYMLFVVSCLPNQFACRCVDGENQKSGTQFYVLAIVIFLLLLLLFFLITSQEEEEKWVGVGKGWVMSKA